PRRPSGTVLPCPPLPRARTSTLFPYTTLFRSCRASLGRIFRQFHRVAFVVKNFRKQLADTDFVVNNQNSGHKASPTFFLHYRYLDRKSTRLNSSHVKTSYAVFCLKQRKHLR